MEKHNQIICIDRFKTSDAFVIAEIGHNHQGSLSIAFDMIKAAKDAGADAVKVQKRDNRSLFTKALYDQSYENENSYGETYGKHREALEFGKAEYLELQAYAKEQNIIFFATPFDFKSLEFLAELNLPAYKIASADLTNTPLQREIAKLGKPVFLSTGGGSLVDIRRAYDNIMPYNQQLCVLHCTASYPTQIENMNLDVIPRLIKEYPEHIVGLSDHENGIDAASIAYMLGARVFEKHFTLNRSWKGTDQSFSLEPDGLRKLVRNLRRIPVMRGSSEKHLLECEKAPLKKMAKSIVASKDLPAGHHLTENDIALKSPSGGLPPFEYDRVLGMVLIESVKEDENIMFEQLIPFNEQ